eukprot:6201748-Lingulodinium_polyedra.AAC.1
MADRARLFRLLARRLRQEVTVLCRPWWRVEQWLVQPVVRALGSIRGPSVGRGRRPAASRERARAR